MEILVERLVSDMIVGHLVGKFDLGVGRIGSGRILLCEWEKYGRSYINGDRLCGMWRKVPEELIIELRLNMNLI